MTTIKVEFVLNTLPVDKDDPMERDEEINRALQKQFQQEGGLLPLPRVV